MLSIEKECCAAVNAAESSASSDSARGCAVISAQLRRRWSPILMLPDETLPRLPFSGPITVTLDSQSRGCFLPNKHDPNVWRPCLGSSDTFQLAADLEHIITACWRSGLSTNCPTVQPGPAASVRSSFLYIQMFTRRFP